MGAPAGMNEQGGRGTYLPTRNVEKCFLMLSKTSVDEVFMHHFEKMSSAPGS